MHSISMLGKPNVDLTYNTFIFTNGIVLLIRAVNCSETACTIHKKEFGLILTAVGP